MAYIPNTLWPDAASYGAGLGQALTQGLMRIPEARAQQQIQLGQLEQGRQQAMMQNALEQQRIQNAAEAQRELQKYHQVMGEAALKRAEPKPFTPEYSPILGPNKLPIGSYDKRTGKFLMGKDAGLEALYGGGGGQPSVVGPTGPMQPTGGGQPGTFNLGSLVNFQPQPTEHQNMMDLINLSKVIGAYQQTGMSTNLPAIFSTLTNRFGQFGQRPAGLPTGMPTAGGQTNDVSGVLNFDPSTGQLY